MAAYFWKYYIRVSVVCGTAGFGINLIPSKYRANVTDTNTDTNTLFIKVDMSLNLLNLNEL